MTPNEEKLKKERKIYAWREEYVQTKSIQETQDSDTETGGSSSRNQTSKTNKIFRRPIMKNLTNLDIYIYVC